MNKDLVISGLLTGAGVGGIFAAVKLFLGNGSSAADGAMLCNKIDKAVIEKAARESLTEKAVGVVRQVSGEPFGVCSHLRNLPKGRHASVEKILTAHEHGFDLEERQTWVRETVKRLRK